MQYTAVNIPVTDDGGIARKEKKKKKSRTITENVLCFQFHDTDYR